jgi:aspartyl-tRNA(Asn)/glutamyl-tRNA(Gln) amidotransferase subunit A
VTNDSIHYSTINQLAARIKAGDLSPVEVVEHCLTRIDRVNPQLNAFAALLADQARTQARKAEREIREDGWRGPLHGIPIGVKDFYDTAGIRTTAAFEKFADRVPARDAVSVAKLKAAGAVIVGKMNMDTLGMGTTGRTSMFGPVRNPWNGRFISGGSSSGSSAAVAAGLCYATLDTDGIGSCRLPAACCGVIGFKGTYGRISLAGVLEGEKPDDVLQWYVHAGLTTRSVEDTAVLVNVLAPPAPAADHGALPNGRSLRIGVVENLEIDAQLKRKMETAVDVFRAVGHSPVAAEAPFDIPPFGEIDTIESDRRQIAQRAFRNVDVLVLPTLASPVLTIEEAGSSPQALSPAHTVFANYFGLPAITLPCGFDGRGLPVGLQIVGKPDDDATVLRIAGDFREAAGRWEGHPVP